METLEVKVIFADGHSIVDFFSDENDVKAFFAKYYPNGEVTYEIIGYRTV